MYCTYYLHVVVILFSTGVFKSAFYIYSFEKLGFSVSAFGFSCFCIFDFWFCSTFWILCHLKRLSNISIIRKYKRCSLILISFHSKNLLKHSHRKRKDILKGSLVQVLFTAELEFPKLLVPSLPQNSSIKCKNWKYRKT